MEFPFPREVSVQERSERVRYEFPRRRLEADAWIVPVLAAIGLGLLAGGGVWTWGLWTSRLSDAFEVALTAGLTLFGLPLWIGGFKLTRFAAALLWGRAVIETCPDVLRARERWGPFEWGRSRRVDSIQVLRVDLEKGQGISLGPRRKGELDVLAPGYPGAWLLPVAHAIAARVKGNPPEVRAKVPEAPAPLPPDPPSERPAGARARVERSGGRLRVVLPSPGFSRQGRSMFIFGLGWTLAMGAVVAALLVAVLRGLGGPGPARMVLGYFVAQFALLWLVGPLFTLTALRQALRSGSVELADSLVVGRDRWPLEEVVGVRRGAGTTSVNGRPIPDLDIHLRNGRVESRFEGRDDAELRWIAGVLSRELERLRPAEAKAVDDPSAPGGECQVCGAAMTAGIVRCPSCRTPHHEECWIYAGRCSTYACGARPTPSP